MREVIEADGGLFVVCLKPRRTYVWKGGRGGKNFGLSEERRETRGRPVRDPKGNRSTSKGIECRRDKKLLGGRWWGMACR